MHISSNALGAGRLAGSGIIDEIRGKKGFDKGQVTLLENLYIELLHE
jgi:hypothetical protein